MSDAQQRLAFHRCHTSISPVAYIARTAASLSPLLIYEFVKDPQRQRRWARIAILGLPALSRHSGPYVSSGKGGNASGAFRSALRAS